MLRAFGHAEYVALVAGSFANMDLIYVDDASENKHLRLASRNTAKITSFYFKIRFSSVINFCQRRMFSTSATSSTLFFDVSYRFLVFSKCIKLLIKLYTRQGNRPISTPGFYCPFL